MRTSFGHHMSRFGITALLAVVIAASASCRRKPTEPAVDTLISSTLVTRTDRAEYFVEHYAGVPSTPDHPGATLPFKILKRVDRKSGRATYGEKAFAKRDKETVLWQKPKTQQTK